MSGFPPALVLSLDLELHWGVRDHVRPGDPYIRALLGARPAVPRMLELFERFGVAATWATVGLLFAADTQEACRFEPAEKPTYLNSKLDPYREPTGASEVEDPLHFGWELIQAIRAVPRQEIGSHTYSHYYCLDEGQTLEQFRADMQSARRIAEYRGIDLRSLVFPRNQVKAAYLRVLDELGIVCYRGAEGNWPNAACSHPGILRRVCRLLDSYFNLTGPNSVNWTQLRASGRPFNLPGSRFLRPVRGFKPLDRLHASRIKGAMLAAARSGEIVHLWWHPHNLGLRTQANLAQLEEILVCFKECESKYGMLSLTMGEVADRISA